MASRHNVITKTHKDAGKWMEGWNGYLLRFNGEGYEVQAQGMERSQSKCFRFWKDALHFLYTRSILNK